jgi:hypothetical protein
MPYVLIWSGWGLWTLAIAVVELLLRSVIGIGLPFIDIGFVFAAILNLLFVRMLESTHITRNGRTMTRAQESTLFFMPLHYWTYIFIVFAIVRNQLGL